MGTARQDYERFVRWLGDHADAVPAGARKMANLTLENFGSVAAAARQHNNRSQLLAGLARQHFVATSADIPELPVTAVQRAWPWRRLQSLTLGPFRGFREPHTFDLTKRIVLCYGPNGSGKSSLCEALEYALRGSVEEAGSKRIDEREYLANIHVGGFAEPSLTAKGAEGAAIRVIPDEEAFRFVFIEKNRIENFARIAATPPGRKSDLIATLFGMDQFNDFASHFNESMDAALTLTTEAQTELAARRQAVAADELTRDDEVELLRTLDADAADYAESIGEGLTFDTLKLWVSGNEQTPSRLEELDGKLRAPLPPITNISRASVTASLANKDASAASLATSQRGLDERRSQVNFRQLFAAIQALRMQHDDCCPACLTPVSEVASNPFQRAESGLRELEGLASLEAEHDRLQHVANEASRAVNEVLRNLEGFLASEDQMDSLAGAYLQELMANPDTPNWRSVLNSPDSRDSGAMPRLEQILVVADQAAARDERTREALQLREDNLSEQARLNDARVWIAEYEVRRHQVADSAAQARERIAQWEVANADLIRRASEEANANARDQPIKEAYDTFYVLLRGFREQLPGMLMADLNAATLELYNEFNFGDRDEDKLADLRLPLTRNDIIEISFQGNPGRQVNALTALSEGHIRCLGLAILLAKAEAVDVPLIIFDDAINAIDHDHRSGIRAAMFESERFGKTQIIVTCHSSEFIKDIENHLSRDARDDCHQYVLLHHQGDYQPRVKPAGTQNYLARAREAIDQRFNARDALSFARKSLEMLTHKAWKWLESHRVGNISVQVEGPGKEPQLYGLCTALRRKLMDATTFAHESKNPLLENLNLILGIPENNLVWILLNKGAHEETNRDDFDMTHVETVLGALNRIDALELRPNR